MTEDQIAADLAQKLKEPEPTVEQVEETPPKTDEQFIHELPPESELELRKWYDYFGLNSIDARTSDTARALQGILDWARVEAGSSDFADVLRVISDQERILGIKLKPGRLSNLYRFAQIRKARLRLIEQERALYGA